MTDELSRCEREETDIGELIRAGHPERFGLCLGAQDWLKEEAILYGKPKNDGSETRVSA